MFFPLSVKPDDVGQNSSLAAFVTAVFGWADVSIVLQTVEQLMFNVTIMCVF